MGRDGEGFGEGSQLLKEALGVIMQRAKIVRPFRVSLLEGIQIESALHLRRKRLVPLGISLKQGQAIHTVWGSLGETESNGSTERKAKHVGRRRVDGVERSNGVVDECIHRKRFIRREGGGPVPTQIDAHWAEGRFELTHQRSCLIESAPRRSVEKEERGVIGIAPLKDREVTVMSWNAGGRPGWKHRRTEFDEDPVGLLRVDEKNVLIVGSSRRSVAQQFKSGVPKPMHCRLNVRHLKRQVMEAFSPAIEKPLDGGLVIEGL